MTLAEIREECWGIARDEGIIDADRLWTTAEMNRYINRVYRHICRETLCLVDTQTPSICLIDSDPVDYTTYTPGTLDYIWANDPDSWLYQQDVAPYLYDLSPLILKIEEVKWTNRHWKLTKVSSRKWQTNPRWEWVVGLPTEYATDLTQKKIALNFRSTESDVLALQVRRLPLADLALDADEPEFRVQYHDFFRNGVLEQMYAKQDADTINVEKSLSYKEQYLDDLDEIKHQEAALDTMLNPNYSMSAFR